MAPTPIRDLEHRFDIGGKIYVVQVCSSGSHTAAPVSAGAFDVQIVTFGADNVSDFNSVDPALLARRVVVEVKPLLPNVSESELAAFHDEIVAWIGEHRRAT